MFGVKEAPHYVLTNLLKLSASSFCENLVCLRPLNMTLQINNFEMMVLIHKHIKSFFFIIKDQMTLVAQSAVCFLSPKYCSPDHFSAINQMDCFFLFPLKWLYIMRRWVYKLSSLSFERLKMLVHNKKVVGYRGGETSAENGSSIWRTGRHKVAAHQSSMVLFSWFLVLYTNNSCRKLKLQKNLFLYKEWYHWKY